MGVPKIKIHKIEPGYTQEYDNDIQKATNGQLLPVQLKDVNLSSVYDLVGVTQKQLQALTPVQYYGNVVIKSSDSSSSINSIVSNVYTIDLDEKSQFVIINNKEMLFTIYAQTGTNGGIDATDATPEKLQGLYVSYYEIERYIDNIESLNVDYLYYFNRSINKYQVYFKLDQYSIVEIQNIWLYKGLSSISVDIPSVEQNEIEFQFNISDNKVFVFNDAINNELNLKVFGDEISSSNSSNNSGSSNVSGSSDSSQSSNSSLSSDFIQKQIPNKYYDVYYSNKTVKIKFYNQGKYQIYNDYCNINIKYYQVDYNTDGDSSNSSNSSNSSVVNNEYVYFTTLKSNLYNGTGTTEIRENNQHQQHQFGVCNKLFLENLYTFDVSVGFDFSENGGNSLKISSQNENLTLLNKGVGISSILINTEIQDKQFQFRTFFNKDENKEPLNDYLINPKLGLFCINKNKIDNKILVCSYYYESNPAKLFVSDYQNWVSQHLRLNPDVFYGKQDYSGDDQIDQNGNTIIVGVMPSYVEKQQYIIDYRNGTVQFNKSKQISDTEDKEVGKARANFSYYKGIQNVINQKLERVDDEYVLRGVRYKVGLQGFTQFPDSVNVQYNSSSLVIKNGKRWIQRTDSQQSMGASFTIIDNGKQISLPQQKLIPTEIIDNLTYDNYIPYYAENEQQSSSSSLINNTEKNMYYVLVNDEKQSQTITTYSGDNVQFEFTLLKQNINQNNVNALLVQVSPQGDSSETSNSSSSSVEHQVSIEIFRENQNGDLQEFEYNVGDSTELVVCGQSFTITNQVFSEILNSFYDQCYVVIKINGEQKYFDCFKLKLINVSDYYQVLESSDSSNLSSSSLIDSSNSSNSSSIVGIVQKNSITISLVRNQKITEQIYEKIIAG